MTRVRSLNGGDGPPPRWAAGRRPSKCPGCGCCDFLLRLVYFDGDFRQEWLCPTFETLMDKLMAALFGPAESRGEGKLHIFPLYRPNKRRWPPL
jgi:hypothetical protein